MCSLHWHLRLLSSCGGDTVVLDGPGFHVEIGKLDEAAHGIKSSIDAQDGFDIADLCGDASIYGHDGLHDALSELCDRWSDGLSVLTDDADAIAETLTNASKAYRMVDAEAAKRMKTDPGAPAVEDG